MDKLKVYEDQACAAVIKDVCDFRRLQAGVNWGKYGSGSNDTMMRVFGWVC